MTALKYWYWDFYYLMSRAGEKLMMGAAWMLPRWLVYYATVRCIAHATTGKYGYSDPTDIRAITVLKRWNTSNERNL